MYKHQTSFAVGEASPNSFGRVDLPSYSQSCRILENAILSEYGSAFKRYGTRYVTSSVSECRLFLFRVDDMVLVVEVRNGEMRILDTDGTEVLAPQTAPWSEAELDQLYVRSAFPNRLYFCHPNYEPRILRRFADGSFRFGVLIFNDQDPVLDPRVKTQVLRTEREDGPPAVDQLLNESDFFIGDDLGTYWQIESGWLEITTYVGPGVLEYTELDSAEYPVEKPVSTTDWVGPWKPSEDATPLQNYTWSNAGGPGTVVQVTADNFPTETHNLVPGDVGQVVKFISPASVVGLIVGFQDNGSSFQFEVLQGSPSDGSFGTSWEIWRLKDRDSRDNSLMTPSRNILAAGAGTTLHCTQPVFSDEMIAGVGDDRNAVITLNQGQVRLTNIVNAYEAQGTIKSRLGEDSPTTEWGQGWSPHTGFPSCVVEHQNRLVFAGFKLFPNLIISSKTGKPQNFRQGSVDDDGLNISVSSDRNNRIRWMESSGDLLVGTEENEFALRGQPLTPTQLGVDLQHSYGGVGVPPQNVGAATLFVTTGSEIREMAFRFERDQYLAPDITNFSRHMFNDPENPVREIEYIRDPEPLVLARQLDGSVNVMTYRRDDPNSIVGWSRWSMKVNSMARVPRNGREEVWFSVTRQVNGQTVNYIEALEPETYTDSHAIGLVAGLNVTGLDHLEGETVQVRGTDGRWYGTRPVFEGRVSSIPAVDDQEVEIGLAQTFRISPQVLYRRDLRGDEPGRRRRLNFVRIQVYQSLGGFVDEFPLSGIQPQQDGNPEDLISTWLERPSVGEAGPDVFEPTYVLEQSIPFPMEVLSVIEGDEQHGR